MRIVEFTVSEPSPGTPPPVDPDGLELRTTARFGDDGPSFVLEASNSGVEPLTLYSDSLAPTVFGTRMSDRTSRFDVPDGPSEALLTRASFWNHAERGPWRSRSPYNDRINSYRVGGEPLARRFTLAPGESRRFTISLTVTSGEYEFVLGYDAAQMDEPRGRTFVSNALPFDVAAEGDDRGRSRRAP